jgi:hypothetical protein
MYLDTRYICFVCIFAAKTVIFVVTMVVNRPSIGSVETGFVALMHSEKKYLLVTIFFSVAKLIKLLIDLNSSKRG